MFKELWDYYTKIYSTLFKKKELTEKEKNIKIVKEAQKKYKKAKEDAKKFRESLQKNEDERLLK